MRYFRIYTDDRNPLPRILNWNSLVKPGRRTEQSIYEALGRNNYLKVELNGECQFMDILCYPCFLASKDMADLIRLYCPNTRFKNMFLYDEANQRTAHYLVPQLEEIDCLHERSELSRDKSEITRGILVKERIEGHPIFRIGQIEGRYTIANLEFIESAYRREVRGMKIEEFTVQ